MKIKINLFILWGVILSGFYNVAHAQLTAVDYSRLLKIPLQYTALKTSEKIIIDGKDEEPDWSKTPWTPLFTDISNGVDVDSGRMTQCKMLWDDDFLYVFARLQEPHLWASITEHDKSVFQDNAFEMFINPDGSNFNYFEFQINAYGTVWDLYMSKPYRNGGKNLTTWDIKGLKKAIQLNGTINHPTDTDKGWNIELAIPFKSVSMSGTRHRGAGTIWRMNFSRVEWDIDTLNGSYVRKRDSITGKLLPEHYSVWSPQGMVNLHMPERWGYVQFSDKLSPKNFLSEQTENLKLVLWKYYYLQQDFKNKNGKYAGSIKELDEIYPGKNNLAEDESKIKMFSNDHQFWIQVFSPDLNQYLSLDEEGEMHFENTVK